MRKAEYYLRIGHEDHGYLSPDLGSMDPYPEYLRREVEESAADVLAHQTPGSFSFGFMTDIHYASGMNHTVRMIRTASALRDLFDRVPVEFLALGGDYTNEGCREYKANCYRQLRLLLAPLDCRPVHGNHDDGSIWEREYIHTEEEHDLFTNRDLYGMFYDHLPKKGIRIDPDGLYYCCDDAAHKVRYVFLNTHEAPQIRDAEGHLKYRAQHFAGLSQKQLDWMAGEALVPPGEGWGFVIFSHAVLRVPKSVPEDDFSFEDAWLRPMSALLRARQENAAVHKTYAHGDLSYTVNADFSAGPKAEILCHLVGHYHEDSIEPEYDYPCILTGNAVMYNGTGDQKILRYDGDKSELLFDVVTVDRTARTVHLTRVGVGEDRDVRY